MKLVQNPDYPELVCVRAVRLLRDLRVRLTFTDNSEREMDLEPYLHGPIFDPIRNDPRLFAQVYVDAETETLTWPNGADIAPETLYYDGNPPWVKQTRPRQGTRKQIRPARQHALRQATTRTRVREKV
ncbi:hypothetical protein ANRL1_00170 [Anaerolineae bacterium]|nr:hypothetical protein ANRL1_00170 [Anaerolineae bacterium]